MLPTPSRDASDRPGLTLVVCILASALVGLDGMMSTVALPAIGRDFDAALAVQQWVVAAFLLGLGSLLLVGGALGDTYGRWPILAVGTAGFGVAALACTLAPNAATLIVARLAQGAAAALMVPAALSLITASFTGPHRARAISTWTAWSGLTVIIGPVLGGVLIDQLTWRATFALLVPLAATVLALSVHAAPSTRPRRIGPRADVLGAALGVVSVGGPVFALIQGPVHGWGDPLVLASLAAGVLTAWAFIVRARTATNPLLPLDLFTRRAFTALTIVTLLLYAGLIASGTYTVLFLTQTAGYSPAAAGLSAAVPMIVLFVLSRPLAALPDHTPQRWLVGGGALLAGIGILLLLRVEAHADFRTQVLPSVLVHGLGLALLVAPLTTAILDSVNNGQAGLASGLNNAVARIGSLLGIGLVGLVISAQFSTSVTSHSTDAPLSPTALQAIEDSRARPMTVAIPTDLPSRQRVHVEQVLTAASVDAFHAGVGVIGAIATLAGLIALITMPTSHRHLEPRYDGESCPRPKDQTM